MTREELTEEKKKLIRLAVAFVVATKHHLRAEGGVHHDDLRGEPSPTQTSAVWGKLIVAGLLPTKLSSPSPKASPIHSNGVIHQHLTASPGALSDLAPTSPRSERLNPFDVDEEASAGLAASMSQPVFLPSQRNIPAPLPRSMGRITNPSRLRSAMDHLKPNRAGLKRRPTNVRIIMPEDEGYENNNTRVNHQTRQHPVQRGLTKDKAPLHDAAAIVDMTERTPLIKPGVTPDIRRTAEDVERSIGMMRSSDVGLGKMIQLGLPLIM